AEAGTGNASAEATAAYPIYGSATAETGAASATITNDGTINLTVVADADSTEGAAYADVYMETAIYQGAYGATSADVSLTNAGALNVNVQANANAEASAEA